MSQFTFSGNVQGSLINVQGSHNIINTIEPVNSQAQVQSTNAILVEDYERILKLTKIDEVWFHRVQNTSLTFSALTSALKLSKVQLGIAYNEILHSDELFLAHVCYNGIDRRSKCTCFAIKGNLVPLTHKFPSHSKLPNNLLQTTDSRRMLANLFASFDIGNYIL